MNLSISGHLYAVSMHCPVSCSGKNFPDEIISHLLSGLILEKIKGYCLIQLVPESPQKIKNKACRLVGQ
jgi:hypothetical protein